MGADDSHFHKITWLFTDGTGTNHLVSLGIFKDLAPGHGRKEIASAPVGHVKIAAKNLTYLVANSKINKLLVNAAGNKPTSTQNKEMVDKLATCSKKEKGQLAPKRKIIFDDTQKTSQRKILGKKADKAAADDKKAADDKTAADDQRAVDDKPAADDKTAAGEKNR